MTQNKAFKRIVREYMDYERNDWHHPISYTQAVRDLLSGTADFTPRCRTGCLSEQRAHWLGLGPECFADSALTRCIRCGRAVCMSCGAPTLLSEGVCYEECTGPYKVE